MKISCSVLKVDLSVFADTAPDLVTGSFTLSSPLAANLQFSDNNVTPVSFSFSDGVQTFSSSSGLTDVFFNFATDGSGKILNWYVLLSNGPTSNRIATSSYIPFTVIDYGALNSSEGEIFNDPGRWSAATTVPEPGSLMPGGAALLVLSAFLRRLR